MDSKTTSPAAPANPLAAMFQNATIDKAEKSEFSNSARDMFKFAVNNYYNFTNEGENRVLESSDAIDFFRNVVQPFLAEVRKNDQSRSNVAETTVVDGSDPVHQAMTADCTPESDSVDVIDIVPLEPSSLPVTSIADRYTRSMLNCLAGYPLYDPKPFSELSKEYPHSGVNVGDVGFVRGNGTFDFLFNICPSKSGFNPPQLPDGFSLETRGHSVTRILEPLPRNTCLFPSPVIKTSSGEYICEGSEGAILELPEGAIEDEATNLRPFEKLAALHGVLWYEYTMTRGRKISNGSLYLITAFTKCTQWGTAVFDRSCAPGQGLKFDKRRSLPFAKSNSKYHWKGSRAFPTKVSNANQGDAQESNQCVFLRGYKIMIRQDIFDKLCNGQPDTSKSGSSNMTRQRATRIRGGGGPDPMSKTLIDGSLFSRTTMSDKTKSDEVVLHANFNPSLFHPSDLINAELLNQNPNAKVALTHDDVWCNILRDNFPKLDYTTLINIARSYTNTLDEYGRQTANILPKGRKAYSVHYDRLPDCVSLQKISDSSNIKESDCPLQRTKTSDLPGPLIIADDDIPVPAKNSLTLPRELVERILLLVDTKCMLTCRLVNREFNGIIHSSTLLQYFLACKAAGVVDNPGSPLSYGERLEALLKREDAWRTLKPVFETTIKVNHQPYAIYALTEGAYFLDDNNQKDMHYCHLPASPRDNPQWITIPSHGHGEDSPGIFVNFAIAVYEHDLIINLISSSDIENQSDRQRYSLDLVLLKFSTGEYHPLARHPRIHVQRSPLPRPETILEVAGDNLALIINCLGMSPAKLFIFDWKTGHRRLQHETTENAYSDLVFVSPQVLLVPNLVLSHFEVWHLSPSHHNPKLPIQILSLKIPAVSPDYSLFDVSCRGAPSPFLHSMPYLPPQPFSSSPENSIIITNLHFETLQGYRNPSCTLIMHRRALLDTIQKCTLPTLLEQRVDLPIWLANEDVVHQMADPGDESVGFCAQSKLVSMMPHPRLSPPTRDFSIPSNPPTLHLSADSGPSSSSGALATWPTSQYNFLQVQWADWGPPISRWFQVNKTQAQWIMNSTGQRYAFSVPNPHDRRKGKVSVADFNSYNFRKNADMMERQREGEDNSSNSNNEEKNGEELDRFDYEGVFSEEVQMGLKCVIYHAPDEYDFDGVLMDEERLVGVKLDGDGREESLRVLYFG